ncbi:acyl-CoA dehydrogenase family protein [Paraburkholderia nemoris]|uniref:acyl-CoA dehydrogenase family protein n=1 Tax=Paraburkholderia nemoris TaxID=2793076 RepID=UPI0038B858FC
MIDFSLTDDQRQMIDAVDRYLTRRLPSDEILRRDATHTPPYDLLPELGELGVLGIPFAPSYGGLGEKWITLALVQERMAQHAYFAASIVSRAVAFGGMSLMTYGSEAQKEQHLPQLIAGRALFALALSEPQAGSDATGITTRAEKVSEGWRIIGRKTWISDAAGATHLVLPARTEKGATGSNGISVFLVPRDSAGIHMTTLDKPGNHCMPSFDIGLDDVFVSDDALLGTQGEGFGHILSTLHYSRSSMAAAATGCAQAVVNLAINHARERVQFGKPLFSNQVLRHRLADMQMRVDQSRLTLYHLAWMLSEGMECKRQAAQAKIIATETLQFVADHGMQILASAGYSMDSHMQRIWRDARLYSYGEGSNEIQRELISRQL